LPLDGIRQWKQLLRLAVLAGRSALASGILPGAEIHGVVKNAEGGHNLNLFASYRISPSVRLGVKNLYGSGFPIFPGQPSILRLGAYERLDLRLDKSWQHAGCKVGLYGELLNATNHYNPVFENFVAGPSGAPVPFTSQGVPITPTVGIALDF
jgi:hypothetical protein